MARNITRAQLAMQLAVLLAHSAWTGSVGVYITSTGALDHREGGPEQAGGTRGQHSIN